ncbi:cellulose synthase-like protein H1 isoform X1 [Dioscorea cayenensis subsp. rotundata]|uniref:Cellulose synthase-like protein H1 isoform X1 n=1 Tax=Dioscorea cayennensis subsp. rotundata TaxID=55577 RepID=A0AB40BBI3_DIOCR|nr:cellulose synthase-like protein H1 isoform X1 [Dioscorea cayenensis subsp. rotundata]
MSTRDSLPLQERVPLNNTLQRASDLLILFLLISLLYCRLISLHFRGFVWLLSFICESWFTFVWILDTNAKWNPVTYKTYPHNLLKRLDELPAVDIFVTTADPKLEPPIITVNTVLSLLAVEYPVEKLACYVSDDAASAATFYSLVQASKFAKLWVPFCKKYDVRVRAPSVYFSTQCPPSVPSALPSDFRNDWNHVKDEYEKLCQRIENACKEKHDGVPKTDEFADFSDVERGNHPSIVKIIWENNKDANAMEDGFPHLIYVSREKRPRHSHHFKAGAMNVLTRVSGVMTNAPLILNVDCDMFANNPEVFLHGMCLLFGFPHEVHSGYVQTPQQFYGGLKDDPFGNQLVVLQHKLGLGIAGLQGPFYGGTGCFHRRKIIYGSPPNLPHAHRYDVLSYKDSKQVFGDCRELLDSAAHIRSANMKTSGKLIDLSAKIEAAKQVASCTYEFNTSWGKEIGWLYGAVVEDLITGLKIQSMGWESKCMTLDPAPFLGIAPTGGPASLTQHKRWATGLLEFLLGPYNPLLATIYKSLSFRQCLTYLLINVWPLRSLFELCYTLLPACSFLTNTSFFPKASEPAIMIPLGLMVSYNVRTLMEYFECGLSIRAWWNNQRMQRIYALTAWLFGFIGGVLKTMGLSETIFELTRKDQNSGKSNIDPRRFTFDSSPMFVPGTAVVMVNMVALVVGLVRMMVNGEDVEEGGGDSPGLGELVCSLWVLLSFWPFIKGLFGKGCYGIPWVIVFKAAALVLLFLQIFAKWS